MQTLYKPSRRVYDAKVIEACHDGDDGHDAYHTGTQVGLTTALTWGAAVATRGVSLTPGQQTGTAAVITLFVAEVEEDIAHGLESMADAAGAAWDYIQDLPAGTGGGPSLPVDGDGRLESHAPSIPGWDDD